ncbi:MAG TPA: tetratricopeptide repeat protein [Polyangia bacterium]|nr:tetratricopeptide repeat protein [Polyangia bacterium]
MARAVLDPPPPVDTARLRARVGELERQRREEDPGWWNDLAGAFIRLGEPGRAVALLAPVVARFPDDYGIHANLGTAYHLLGRYPEAQREIARDLEINPAGHFGLERYHLALLQYLTRDPTYRGRHVYVDEWSIGFMLFPNLYLSRIDAGDRWVREMLEDPDPQYRERRDLLQAIVKDPPPGYRAKWDLAADPKLDEGILYMASLNRDQPAAVVMLGIACLRQRDLNLAAAAFRRALALGSPQASQLRHLVESLDGHIASAAKYRIVDAILEAVMLTAALAVFGLVLLYFGLRRARAG